MRNQGENGRQFSHGAMRRRDFLRMSGAAAVGLVLSCRPAPMGDLGGLKGGGEDYNILFVFADELQCFALGCMGNRNVRTPNLNKLAAKGTLFKNAYSCYPHCTQYRAALYTSRYASQTGVFRSSTPILPNERTLAAALNDGGYRTSFVGKWCLGRIGNRSVPDGARAGFTDFIGYQSYDEHIKYVWFFDENNNKFESKKHRTEATTDFAVERLEKIADKKFAMFVSYQSPHYPEQPPKEYEDMYAKVKIKRRANCQDIDPYTETRMPNWKADKDPMNKRYDKSLDTYLRLYYAMVTQLDANIGRLLNKLKELKLEKKTVVIFTSDHGDMQGSHGLKNANLFYEESVRVPLIVRVPGGPAGVVSNELVSSIDLFPTILDYAKLPKEPTAEGISFASIARGMKQQLNDAVFAEGGNTTMYDDIPECKPWIMIRDKKYKSVIDREYSKPTHLFDLEKDPYEMNNLLDEENMKSYSDQEREEIKAVSERLLNRSTLWYEDIRKRVVPAAEEVQSDDKNN